MSDTALAYCRVSTISQQAHGKNLDAQEAEIKDFCDAHGYRLAEVDVYRDRVSGARKDRAGYYELLQRVEEGDADVIVAYAVDRLGRNNMDNAWLLTKAEEFGLRLETVSGGGRNFLEDPESELLYDILTAVAKFERKSILKRMQRGKRKGAQRGNHVVGQAPLGWRIKGPRGDKRLKPAADEVAEVVDCFRAYTQAESYNRTAQILDAAYESSWYPEKVKRVLGTVEHIGNVSYKDQIHEGRQSPLVPEGLWERVQELREATSGRQDLRLSEEWECPRCGFETDWKPARGRHIKSCGEGL